MWLTSSSMCRNEASSGLSRSVLTGLSLHEGNAAAQCTDGSTAPQIFLLVTTRSCGKTQTAAEVTRGSPRPARKGLAAILLRVSA